MKNHIHKIYLHIYNAIDRMLVMLLLLTALHSCTPSNNVDVPEIAALDSLIAHHDEPQQRKAHKDISCAKNATMPRHLPINIWLIACCTKNS